MGIENKCTIVNVIQSLSHVWFFAATWTQHARLPCPTLSPGVCTNSCPLSRWCYPTISSSASPLLILPLIFPSIRIFSNESTLLIRWPKYWSFSFSINLSNEFSGLISFRIDWFDLLIVQGTLESSPTPQFKSINSLVLSFLYSPTLTSMTTGKTIALTRQTFVGKVRSLLLNMLSRLHITLLPRSKRLLISWLQSPSAVILEPPQNKVWHCFHCFPIYFPWSDGTRWHDLRFLNVEL